MSAAAATALIMGAYMLGTFPTALVVGRRLGFDPTAEGSGNPGASNTVRVGGTKAGAMVLLGDVAKGMVAAGTALWLAGYTLGWALGAAAVAGHMWPFTRGFRGGKGVATAGGVGLVLFPLAMIPMAALFGVIVRVVGTAAAGSIIVAAAMPVVMLVAGRSIGQIAIGEAIAIAIIVRHLTNIAEMTGRSSPRD